jgi:hypothetical protein
MDAWMDGWMNGCVGGWMERGWMDAWVGGWMDGWMDKWQILGRLARGSVGLSERKGTETTETGIHWSPNDF